MQDVLNTTITLVNQSVNDTLFLRTGRSKVGGPLEIFADTLKVPLRSIRRDKTVVIDFSYNGERHIVKVTLIEGSDGNIVLRGITTGQLNKLHVVYGAWLREKMGTLELKMHVGHMEYVALHETAGGNV